MSEPQSQQNKSQQAPAAKKPEKVFQTTSQIVVHPFYTPADLSRFDYDKELNAPGRFPFTRGVQASMYRGQLWTMRQYAGMGDAGESNRRYHYLLSHGTTGLSVAFDLPTQIGYDSDHLLAQGEVGRWAWPSTRWKTCSGCLRASTWKRFPPR